MINFAMPSKTEKYDYKIHPEVVQFVMLIGKGFPCTAPRLHIKTSIVSPGFDDCRNLLYQILGTGQWNHHISLKHIQQKMMKFLAEICTQNEQKGYNIYNIARIGQFNMNTMYPVEAIKEIRGNIYFAFEYAPDHSLKMLIIDISSTHLVLFMTAQQPSILKGSVKIPNQNQITLATIVFVAELGSIVEVAVDRTNFNDFQIVFWCKKPQSMQMNTTRTVKKLKIRKGETILNKLLKNMGNYSLNYINLQSPSQLQSKQQKKLLALIKEAQKQLQHRFNSQTIQNLNESYQKIVEHYSINNIPFCQLFVHKITLLYQRTDVQCIINGQQNNKNIQ